MEEKQTIICDRCKVPLEEHDAQFSYLDRTFRHKVLRCPICGQVSLTEEIVGGRMKEVEALMEEK
ncbi:MAG: DNA-binding protein [Anaerovoracaceae bacterium]